MNIYDSKSAQQQAKTASQSSTPSKNRQLANNNGTYEQQKQTIPLQSPNSAAAMYAKKNPMSRFSPSMRSSSNHVTTLSLPQMQRASQVMVSQPLEYQNKLKAILNPAAPQMLNHIQEQRAISFDQENSKGRVAATAAGSAVIHSPSQLKQNKTHVMNNVPQFGVPNPQPPSPFLGKIQQDGIGVGAGQVTPTSPTNMASFERPSQFQQQQQVQPQQILQQSQQQQPSWVNRMTMPIQNTHQQILYNQIDQKAYIQHLKHPSHQYISKKNIDGSNSNGVYSNNTHHFNDNQMKHSFQPNQNINRNGSSHQQQQSINAGAVGSERQHNRSHIIIPNVSNSAASRTQFNQEQRGSSQSRFQQSTSSAKIPSVFKQQQKSENIPSSQISFQQQQQWQPLQNNSSSQALKMIQLQRATAAAKKHHQQQYSSASRVSRLGQNITSELVPRHHQEHQISKGGGQLNMSSATAVGYNGALNNNSLTRESVVDRFYQQASNKVLLSTNTPITVANNANTTAASMAANNPVTTSAQHAVPMNNVMKERVNSQIRKLVDLGQAVLNPLHSSQQILNNHNINSNNQETNGSSSLRKKKLHEKEENLMALYGTQQKIIDPQQNNFQDNKSTPNDKDANEQTHQIPIGNNKNSALYESLHKMLADVSSNSKNKLNTNVSESRSGADYGQTTDKNDQTQQQIVKRQGQLSSYNSALNRYEKVQKAYQNRVPQGMLAVSSDRNSTGALIPNNSNRGLSNKKDPSELADLHKNAMQIKRIDKFNGGGGRQHQMQQQNLQQLQNITSNLHQTSKAAVVEEYQKLQGLPQINGKTSQKVAIFEDPSFQQLQMIFENSQYHKTENPNDNDIDSSGVQLVEPTRQRDHSSAGPTMGNEKQESNAAAASSSGASEAQKTAVDTMLKQFSKTVASAQETLMLSSSTKMNSDAIGAVKSAAITNKTKSKTPFRLKNQAELQQQTKEKQKKEEQAQKQYYSSSEANAAAKNRFMSPKSSKNLNQNHQNQSNGSGGNPHAVSNFSHNSNVQQRQSWARRERQKDFKMTFGLGSFAYNSQPGVDGEPSISSSAAVLSSKEFTSIQSNRDGSNFKQFPQMHELQKQGLQAVRNVPVTQTQLSNQDLAMAAPHSNQSQALNPLFKDMLQVLKQAYYHDQHDNNQQSADQQNAKQNGPGKNNANAVERKELYNSRASSNSSLRPMPAVSDMPANETSQSPEKNNNQLAAQFLHFDKGNRIIYEPKSSDQLKYMNDQGEITPISGVQYVLTQPNFSQGRPCHFFVVNKNEFEAAKKGFSRQLEERQAIEEEKRRNLQAIANLRSQKAMQKLRNDRNAQQKKKWERSKASNQKSNVAAQEEEKEEAKTKEEEKKEEKDKYFNKIYTDEKLRSLKWGPHQVSSKDNEPTPYWQKHDSQNQQRQLLEASREIKAKYNLLNLTKNETAELYKYVLMTGNNSQVVKRVMNSRPSWALIKQHQTTLYHFKWAPISRQIKFENLGKHGHKQLVNHFENHALITTKDQLIESMAKLYENLNGQDIFNTIPMTFVLDLSSPVCQQEYDKFNSLFGFVEKYKLQYNEAADLDAKAEVLAQINRDLKQHHALGAKNRKKKPLSMADTMFDGQNLWLFKPADMNRGRGVCLFSSIDQLKKLILEHTERADSRQFQNFANANSLHPKSNVDNGAASNSFIPDITNTADGQTQQPSASSNIAQPAAPQQAPSTQVVVKSDVFVIQKYIEKPLLINQRKFDIRLWVLVTPEHKCFYFKEGYIRMSGQKFSLDEQDNVFVHLTNNAIQKQDKNYGEFEEGNILSYKEGSEFLRKQDGIEIDFYQFTKDEIVPVLEQTMMSVRQKLNKNQRKFCMEIFGYDFMVDSVMRPWLIEVNTNPCLEESNQLLRHFIPRMLDDAFKLTLDVLYPPMSPAKIAEALGSGSNAAGADETSTEPQQPNKGQQPPVFSIPGWPDNENLWGQQPFYILRVPGALSLHGS